MLFYFIYIFMDRIHLKFTFACSISIASPYVFYNEKEILHNVKLQRIKYMPTVISFI